MFHETQYRAGLAHAVKVGPALTKKSIWQEDDFGEAPVLTILNELQYALVDLDAIVVDGPTSTSTKWLDTLTWLADMSYIDKTGICPIEWDDDRAVSFRCIVLDEVGDRTRVLLVNGLTAKEVDPDRHSTGAHEADALECAARYEGAPHAGLCQQHLEALVHLGAFRL